MNDRHDFSKEYEEKKKALLRSIEKADRVEKRQHRMPVMRAITAAALAIVMLSGGVFAATKLGLFNIRREGDKILVEVKTGQVTEQLDPPGRVEPKWFRLYSDYVPPVTGCEAGAVPNYGIGITKQGILITERGAEINVLLADYTTKEDFILQLPPSTEIEEFDIDGRRAILTYFGETVEWNKILFVEFEEEGLLAYCMSGFRITEDELKKFAEGLSIEAVSDEEAQYLFSNDETFMFYCHAPMGIVDLTDSAGNFIDPDLPHIPAIDEMTRVNLGESFSYFNSEFNMNVELTPLEVKVYDSASDFDYEKFSYLYYSIITEDGNKINHISNFMDEDGNLIEYPRSTVIEAENETEQDRFGETEMVRKKLVCVTYNVKNTTDRVSNFSGCGRLRIGNEYTDLRTYVYDRTPMFYTNQNKVYMTGVGEDGCELAPGEEITVTDYYLVDEDLMGEAYHEFNGARRYIKLAD